MRQLGLLFLALCFACASIAQKKAPSSVKTDSFNFQKAFSFCKENGRYEKGMISNHPVFNGWKYNPPKANFTISAIVDIMDSNDNYVMFVEKKGEFAFSIYKDGNMELGTADTEREEASIAEKNKAERFKKEAWDIIRKSETPGRVSPMSHEMRCCGGSALSCEVADTVWCDLSYTKKVIKISSVVWDHSRLKFISSKNKKFVFVVIKKVDGQGDKFVTFEDNKFGYSAWPE